MLKKYFQTVKGQKGDCISQEAIFHGGKKLIIGSFKCFKNKLAALNKTAYWQIRQEFSK